MTGRTSFGLGRDAYQKALEAASITLVGTQVDEGENHYYFGQKT
jgi:hypothetical protein